MFAKLATLAILASASATPIRRTEPCLKVTTEAPATADSVENVWVATTVTNTGSEPLEFNPHGTVFNNAPTDDFDVDGTRASGKAKRPNFVGFHAKHVTDIATLRKLGLMKSLAPGESIVANTTLAERYDLSPSGSGDYKIGAKPKFHVVPQNADQFESVHATVEPASVRITGALGRTRTRQAKRDITFEQCSAEQQGMINLAAANAQTGSQTAAQYLTTAGGDQNFAAWFGTPTTESVATALQHYTNMNGLFANVKYDCAYCASESGTFAMVQPDDISTIYLCGYYWQSQSCGVDSQQGTLVHEASHFNAVAGTDDIAYGQQDASALAASNPAQALMNADNHEYFEETVYTACSASATVSVDGTVTLDPVDVDVVDVSA